ncbi:restriction endonuclease subunit S [Leucobacter sp. HY1908]
MSRIDDLIAEHCPDGVTQLRVGDSVSVVATPRGIKRSLYQKGSKFAIVDQGQSLVAGFTDDAALLLPESQYIVFGDHTRAVKWIDFPFAVGADGTKVLLANEDLLPKFAYYALENLIIADRGYNRHWSVVREMPIPVPPIEVQRAIVEVLDTFSKLEAELKAELEAELEARKQQYEYYLNQLLTPQSLDRDACIPMGEIGVFTRGRRFTKGDVAESGIPSIHYGEIYTEYGASATQAVREVRADLQDQLRFAQPNDVVFAGVGETVEDVGKAVAWLGDHPVAVHDDTFFFTSKLNPKYVAYFSQTNEFNLQKESRVARGKVKRLSSAGLAAIRIPILRLEEQRRIVAILDKFDALVNDLSVGLPAELAARRQQYEYYRDKLLTFKELEAAA